MGKPLGPTVHWVAIARDGGRTAVVVCGKPIGANEWGWRTSRSLDFVNCGECKCRSHLFAECPPNVGLSWWKDDSGCETPNNGTGGLI